MLDDGMKGFGRECALVALATAIFLAAPCYGQSPSSPELSGTAHIGLAPSDSTAVESGFALPPRIRPSRLSSGWSVRRQTQSIRLTLGRRATFPRRTLVGAAIGSTLAIAYLIVIDEDRSLIGTSGERLMLISATGVGALIGFALER